MKGYEFLIMAAQITKGDGDHWFRYLHKVINEKGILLQDWEIDKALHSNQLTDFQKVTLVDATTEGTHTHEFISSRSKPGWRPFWRPDIKKILESLREQYGDHKT